MQGTFVLCTGVLSTFVLASAVTADICPESDHNCFATGGPGCTFIECCKTVCAADPFCCDVAWDGLCVSGAIDLCIDPACPWDFDNNGVVDGRDLGILLNLWSVYGGEGLGELLNAWGPCPVSVCPPSDHDCFTTGGPGCTDIECCELVCAADPFCCDVSWDGLCVSGAQNLCEVEPGICPPSDHDCFTTGGPGCTDIECCELVCAADPFCCDVSWDGLCVSGAQNLCEVEPGICPPSDHDCFTTGGPGCTDIECCELVCAADPFCCDVAWDGLCVSGAQNLCEVEPGICPPSDHDCFTTGGPGCTDIECCELVCAADPFCCDVAWDGLCVGDAKNLC